MTSELERIPWVLVAGGFHQRGGMDKANSALAAHLISRGVTVHLVCHSADAEFLGSPLATVHTVPAPAGSFLLGERRLDWVGRTVARMVRLRNPGLRVVVNGGNCCWPDINWVHSVHRAWPSVDHGSPVWFKLKNRMAKSIAKWSEARALRAARVVLANSEKTRRELIELLGIPAQQIHTVYLGADAYSDVAEHSRPGLFRSPTGAPLIAFVGALSHDHNKGFDVLWPAWKSLCANDNWDGHLVVAGGGSGLSRWKSECEKAGLSHRVQFLGFTTQVVQLLAQADLLVSPVRYEAYGLNAQEAICRGVPALVSANAGIAERYPRDLLPMLLPDPPNVTDLADRMLKWQSNRQYWRTRFESFGETLRENTWTKMASRIVEIVESCDQPIPRSEEALRRAMGLAG